MKKFYITTPIYYVNDKPHIGHAYTTIAADVLARYWRKKLGQPQNASEHEKCVFFLTGTDEHGQKVADAAREQGIGVEDFVDQKSKEFQETFKALNISNDIFMRTTSEKHNTSVQKFMKVLKDAGALELGEYEGLYCKGCEDFYLEKDLKNGLCPIHGTKPDVVKEKNWFFKLSQYLGDVEDAITEGRMLVEPASKLRETLGLITEFKKQGKKANFSVTRERVTWGLDFIEGNQKIYVWVEALQNYISALEYPDGDQFKKFWPADVHLMAKDIIKFHAVYWPAMLLAAGVPLPKKIFAHGFFSLNGKKMSKSLGNVIHPQELIDRYFSADAVRYLLLSQFVFGQDGDFTLDKMDDIYKSHLADRYGNLASRLSALIEQSGGKVAGKSPHIMEVAVKKYLSHFGEQLEQLDFNGALSTIHTALNYLDKKIADDKPWEKDSTNPERIIWLSDAGNAFLRINDALEPLLPSVAAVIRKGFSQENIKKINPLFPRIESKKI